MDALLKMLRIVLGVDSFLGVEDRFQRRMAA